MNIPPFELRPVLAKGLRKNAEDPATEGLALMYNRKPSRRGAIAIDAPSNPVTGADTTLAFPYPMLIPGTLKNLYFQYVSSAHHLYEMAVGSWAAGTDKITTNTLPNVTGTGTVTLASATQWGYAENDDVFFISNGDRYLTNAPVYGAWKAGIYTGSAVPKAFCFDSNKRLIMGNFQTPANYYTQTTGKRLWDVFSRQAPITSFSKLGNVPGANFVMWGLDGGGDVDQPYSLEQSFLSFVNIDEYEQILLDMFRDWNMGFCFLPWAGSLQCAHRLGDVIMLYGSENIGYLAPLQNGGYTPRWLMGVGIPSIRAACGNENEHIVLDKEGFLWRISAGLKIEQLRYQEFLSSFTSANPVISYDSSLGEFYISKADKAYILTPYGLAEAKYAPTSLISYNNSLYGPAAEGADGYILKTGVINQDSRKVKTLENVELGKEDPTDSTCLLNYRAKTGPYKETDPIDFSAAGIVDFVTTAIDFQVTIESEEETTEAIPFATINFRDTNEKRGIAGYTA